MPDTTPALVSPVLQGRVADLIRQHHLPGAATGVVRDQHLIWSAGFGYADIAGRRVPDEHTLYRVASITKTFTATAIMQLRDAGRLRLDDPLVLHLPQFASVICRHGAIEDVTIRRLLSHQSGLITEGPFSYWDTLDFPVMEAVLAGLAETEVVIEPATATKYSNLAYALLGEVVGRLSGRPYEEYVRSEIFEPLGMTSSTFAPDGNLQHRLATGYNPHPFEDSPEPAGHTGTKGITAAAGLYTTVDDLARWIGLQLRAGTQDRDDPPVLKAITLEAMHLPVAFDPAWNSANCLGWAALRRGEQIFHGHGGSIHGFITQILFSKPARLGVIVLTNEGRHAAANTIAVEMLQMLLEHEPGVENPASWEPPLPTPSQWRRLLGQYEFWRGGMVHIEYRDGMLRLALPPGVTQALHAPAVLRPTEQEQTFCIEGGRAAGELLRFRLAPSGAVLGFTVAGFTYDRLIAAEKRTGDSGLTTEV
ncbi:MAG: serine hydrolase domain-containing protein [Dehalococcoidia bacterium]